MNSPDPTTMIGVSSEGWRLERHDHGRLDLVDAKGGRHHDVDVLRAFPWIESLTEQPGELRSLLERELAQREFLPVIERIEAISDAEPPEWTVATDRGRHRFRVAHTDDISRQPDGGVFITDTFGLRYRIPRESALDATSRRLLDKAS